MRFKKAGLLRGEIRIPGDKSISHRGIMLGAIAKGMTEIRHFLQGADCLSTISCFQKMGVRIENNADAVLVHGKGLRGLKCPDSILDCGNSGTTARLISGILSAQEFSVMLTGDESIQRRPMNRMIEPLSLMGAQIESIRQNGCVPLQITGKPLHGIHYRTKIASAQVKSAILLAGLYAEGETSVTEPCPSRNHSELMLRSFGSDIRCEGTAIFIKPAKELYGQCITVPGDISSAAPFLAAALLIRGSELLIRHVGINPTRDGMIHACRAMGADLSLSNIKNEFGDPTADILVKSSCLHGTVIEGAAIPTLIDELPLIAVMACFAEGTTIIKDAAELKVKESNRLEVMAVNLKAMGADVTETADGMVIRGGKPLHGIVIDSRMDHRIAMAFAVAGLCVEGETEVQGAECVNISYPEFYQDLTGLIT